MTANFNPGPMNSRRLFILAGVAVFALIGLWAIFATSRRKVPDSAPATAAATPKNSMAGMAGMSTSSKGTVMLTADQIRQFGITFGTAEVRPLTAETRTTGIVTFDETRMAEVAPKIGGFVERLYVNATGQRVSRGQPLLELYSPELVAAQQELLVAGQLQRDIGRSAVPGVPGNSTDLVAASRRRLALWDISEQQINEILRTGRVRRTLTLYSPASGVVVQKNVLQGQAISVGQTLYTIADLSDVWINVQLREADAAAVRVGSGADIDFAGLPGRTLKGRVTYVYPTLDSTSRAVESSVG